jgi:hypothetical protein
VFAALSGQVTWCCRTQGQARPVTALVASWLTCYSSRLNLPAQVEGKRRAEGTERRGIGGNDEEGGLAVMKHGLQK